MILTVPISYSYCPDHALKQDIELVQRSMNLALDFLSKEGDEKELLSKKVAWVVELKRAMSRVKGKDLQRFLFERFTTHSSVPVPKVMALCKGFAKWLQTDKSLERRKMPWDTVIYMVHVPDDTEMFLAKYETLLLFRAHEHLQIL